MMMSSQLALSSLVLLVVLGSHAVLGFSPSVVLHCSHASSSSSSSSDTTVQLNMFGNAFKDAFSNDDGLGARKNEGLSNGPEYNEAVTINGKAVKGAVVGQKLTRVAMQARVKIPVNCQQGDCGTCMVKMNGRKVKACQTSLGKGKCSIETL